jgi:cyclohexanecarboxylate-CoA ligase
MVKRGLDRVLGEGNWGPPKWAPGNYPKLSMSYMDRTGWLPRGKTIGEYWERAVMRNPDGIAFVDTVEGEERAVNFKEADMLMKKLALALIDMGIKPGKKVATALSNSVRYSLSILAINYIGAVWVPLHSFLREVEWSYILKHADVEVVICDELHRGYSLAKLAAKMQSQMEILNHVIVWGSPEQGQLNFQDLIEKDWSGKYPGQYINDVYLKENLFTSDDLSEIIYTSGTTGPPKGAIHTHDDNLYHSLCFVYHYDLGSEDSLLNLAIMSHQHGYGVLWLPFVLSSLPQYFIGDWNPEQALKVINRYKPTLVGLNPPIITALAGHPELEKIDTSTVRAFVSAGAPIPFTSAREAKKRWGNPYFCIVNGYGMSECNGECATPLGDFGSAEFAVTSVGLPHIGCQVKITEAGNRDKILPIGRQGEISARGGLVGPGYYKDLERTHADWDTKGWMYSGDLGEMDESGNIYITGRSKDVILRGGNVVQPLFMEEFIRQYPDVADVAVVGMPHEKLVETACAVIVPKEKGRVFTREEIYSFMKDKTMRDNIPDRVETWDSLIYTATGKQIKYRIKEKVLENLEKENKE